MARHRLLSLSWSEGRTWRWTSLLLGAIVAAGCGPGSSEPKVGNPDAPLNRDVALEASPGFDVPHVPDAGPPDRAMDSSPVSTDSAMLDSSPIPSDGATAQACQLVAAGVDGGWQFARFAKTSVTGKSGAIELTMGDWQCKTAPTEWTQKDTSVACMDGAGIPHTLFMRIAFFDPICGNQNSCAWIRLSDTQTMPTFTGSNLGVNGYWDAANYQDKAQLFQVGIIDAYSSDPFIGNETAQDLHLSQNFSVCIQYAPTAPGTDAATDAATDTPSDPRAPDAPAPGTNALTPVRTFAFHELTSLAAEPANWPVISGDGRVVAFTTGVASPSGQVIVNVGNADGTGQQVVDTYTPLCYCSGVVDINSDGKHLVSTEGTQIRHAQVGGAGNPVLKLTGNEISDIRISADGTRIFFLLRRDAVIGGTSTSLERGVYVVGVDGNGLRQITGPSAMAVGLAVTPDKIFPFSGCGRSMDISADGSRVAFAASVAGMERVFAVNADGSGVRKLVDASGGFKIVDKIAMSGDGRLVAYHVYVGDGAIEMGVIGYDGTGRLKLGAEPAAPLGACEGQVRFTQDGKKLYVSEPGYLYDTDGTGVLQLAIGVVKPPGGSPVKDGTWRGWMDNAGKRFVYKNIDDKNIPQLMLLEVDPATLGPAPVLTDPTFTPVSTTVAGLGQAVASIRAGGTGIKTVGVSFSRNGLPDVIDRGPGIAFADKGASGDTTAGDGVWSGKGFAGYTTPSPGPRSVRFTAEASVSGKRHATVLEAGNLTIQ